MFLSHQVQSLGTTAESLDEGAGFNLRVRADRTFWNKGQKQEIALGISSVTELIRGKPRFLFPEPGTRKCRH